MWEEWERRQFILDGGAGHETAQVEVSWRPAAGTRGERCTKAVPGLSRLCRVTWKSLSVLIRRAG